MLTVLVPPPEYWLGPDAILVHDLYTKRFVGNSIIVILNYYTLLTSNASNSGEELGYIRLVVRHLHIDLFQPVKTISIILWK
jgi:hypothetical protein